MTGPDDIRLDLPDDLDPASAAGQVDLGHRLLAQRPTPRAAFRGDLRRRLLGRPEARRRVGPVPRAIRVQIATSGLAGVGLLAIGALSVIGLGPLAA